jgi:hypothetical protein
MLAAVPDGALSDSPVAEGGLTSRRRPRGPVASAWRGLSSGLADVGDICKLSGASLDARLDTACPRSGDEHDLEALIAEASRSPSTRAWLSAHSAGQLRRPGHSATQAPDQRRLAGHLRRAHRRPAPRRNDGDGPPPAAHPLVGPVAGVPGRRLWPRRVPCPRPALLLERGTHQSARRSEANMPEDPTQPRYPDTCVQLSGEDGNAFAILGRTAGALRRAGLAQEEIDDYFAEATSGDHTTCCKPPCAGWIGSSDSRHPRVPRGATDRRSPRSMRWRSTPATGLNWSPPTPPIPDCIWRRRHPDPGVRRFPEPTIDVQGDDGGTVSVLAEAGDISASSRRPTSSYSGQAAGPHPDRRSRWAARRSTALTGQPATQRAAPPPTSRPLLPAAAEPQ